MLYVFIQLCCATAVNLSGGRTRDGGKAFGASVFYTDCLSAAPNPLPADEVDRLNQELQVIVHYFILN